MKWRSIWFFAAFVGVGVAVGCGGQSTEPTDGLGRSASDDLATADFDDEKDINCVDLAEKINKLREEVTSCCPSLKCSLPQCGKVAQDICCPITVNGGPIDEFEKATALYREKCHAICLAVVCPKDVPSNYCEGTGVCRKTGGK